MAPRASAAVASPFHTLSSAGWIFLLVMSTYLGNCGNTLPVSVSDRNTSANGALNEALTSALPIIAGTAGEPPDEAKAIWPSGPARYCRKAQAASFTFEFALMAKPAPPASLACVPSGPAGSGATAHLNGTLA